MKTPITIICLWLTSWLANAQTIQMNFPAFAGKAYELVIFQGSQSVKAQVDTIPASGRFELKIPQKYAPYTGMCRWLLTNNTEGGGLDMSIPGHGFSVSCISGKPDNKNITYSGYDPVNELNLLNTEQKTIIDKFEVMNRALSLYDEKSTAYPVFQKEAKEQQNRFDAFQTALKSNPNYAARFLPIVNMTQGIPPHLGSDNKETMKNILDYIVNSINIDDLYTSGHWPAILDTWAQIEINAINDDAQFLASFQKLSARIANPDYYTDFIGVITKTLTRFGKDKQIDLITPYVMKSGKITNFSGALSVYQKALVGQQAPALVITEHVGKVEDHNHSTKTIQSADFAYGEYKKTLLIFYESGCGPCEELMQQLPGNYELLKSKSVRIIAIAADHDENMFKNTSYNFPWKDTYCDYEGKAGINFRNYAVSGTPTIYLIDKQGKIEKKLATLEEILKTFK